MYELASLALFGGTFNLQYLARPSSIFFLTRGPESIMNLFSVFFFDWAEEGHLWQLFFDNSKILLSFCDLTVEFVISYRKSAIYAEFTRYCNVYLYVSSINGDFYAKAATSKRNE